MIQDIKAVNVVLWPSRQRDSSREILEPRHSFPFWHCNTRKLFSRENNDLLSATTVWYGIVSVQGSRYEKFQTSLRGFIKLRYQFPCVTVIINQRDIKSCAVLSLVPSAHLKYFPIKFYGGLEIIVQHNTVYQCYRCWQTG